MIQKQIIDSKNGVNQNLTNTDINSYIHCEGKKDYLITNKK